MSGGDGVGGGRGGVGGGEGGTTWGQDKKKKPSSIKRTGMRYFSCEI